MYEKDRTTDGGKTKTCGEKMINRPWEMFKITSFDERNKSRMNHRQTHVCIRKKTKVFTMTADLAARWMFFHDRNYNLNGGAPGPTHVIEKAVRLCNMLGINVKISPSRTVYQNEWEGGRYQLKMVVAALYLTATRFFGRLMAIIFSFLKGDLQIFIGIDVKKYSISINIPDFFHNL